VLTAIADRGADAMAAAAVDARSSLAALVALRPQGGAAVHADLAVVGALLGDRERAVRLTRSVLGPLAEPTPRNVDLVDTLEAYFACGERKAGAAARLGVHEKTVAHRLRRAEELLGATVSARRAALETAVVLHRLVVRSG
jgi:DNA-binding PucR family transcriptional regulator